MASPVLPPSLDLSPHLSAHKYFFVCTLTVAAWDTLVLSPRAWKLARQEGRPPLKLLFHFLQWFMPLEFIAVGQSTLQSYACHKPLSLSRCSCRLLRYQLQPICEYFSYHTRLLFSSYSRAVHISIFSSPSARLFSWLLLQVRSSPFPLTACTNQMVCSCPCHPDPRHIRQEPRCSLRPRHAFRHSSRRVRYRLWFLQV